MKKNIENLFVTINDMATNNRLNKIQDLNQALDIDIYGNKCNETYCYLYQSTLLGIAAFEGNLTIVNSLLDAGADANSLSWGYRQFYTPIHLTIYGTSQYGTDTSRIIPLSERIEIIRSLNNHGADLNWTGDDLYAWSTLHTAAHVLTSGPGTGNAFCSEILRLGADPHTFPATTINPLIFVSLACEEAADKYNSDTGYKFPKHLHDITSNYLQSFRFQYSQEIQKLQIIDMESNGKLLNFTCPEEVNPAHTEIFDLSGVAYVGDLTLQGLLDS